MAEYINIDFSVYAETNLGEEVFISGNIEELGSWNPNLAMKLQTSKEVYPEWLSKKTLELPPHISLEFKVFILTPHGQRRWENFEDNRKFVPTGSVLISLTESKEGMIFEPKIIRERTKKKKNTFEVVYDHSDEVSESSSGNEREFWFEKANREKTGLLNSDQIVNEAKALIECWQNKKKEEENQFPCEWLYIVDPIHFVIRKERCLMLRKESLKEEINKTSQKSKSNNLDVHEVSESELEDLANSKSYPEKSLKFFHVEQDEVTKDVILKIKKFYDGFYILHMNKLEENLLGEVEMIVVTNKEVLKQILNNFIKVKKYELTMLKEKEFLVRKNHEISVLIYFNPKLTEFWPEIQNNKEYFGVVEKNLLNKNNIHFPDNLRLSLLIESNILKRYQKSKFIVVVVCDKISELPARTTTTLIRSSSCADVSVHIITSDELSEVYKKFPISENDKIYVYTKNGELFKPDKKEKTRNLFDEIKVNKTKYEEIFRQLKEKAKYWLENKEAEIEENFPYYFQISCRTGIIGYSVSEYLFSEFNKMNTISKFPFRVEKFENEDKKRIVVEVCPLVNSHEFYSKLILSSSLGENKRNLIFSFDFTANKYSFNDKIEQHCIEKKAIFEGFIMQKLPSLQNLSLSENKLESEISQKGLRQEKLEEFLNELTNKCEFSVIEDELERKSSNRIGSRNYIGIEKVIDKSYEEETTNR